MRRRRDEKPLSQGAAQIVSARRPPDGEKDRRKKKRDRGKPARRKKDPRAGFPISMVIRKDKRRMRPTHTAFPL